MEPETELDAVLIDEFDAEGAPVRMLRADDASLRRKPPVVSGFSGIRTVPVGRDAVVNECGASSSPSLRHYPSLEAFPVPTHYRYEARAMSERQTSYPRFESVRAAFPEPNNTDPAPTHRGNRTHPAPPSGPLDERPHIATDLEVAHAQQTQHALHTHTENKIPDQEPVVVTAQVDMEPVLTDEELAREKRQIEAELRRFQQQADHVARALAGDTPHQREMRRLREIERQEREGRRLAAVETRIEHMVERELQREARQEQRRQRLAERAHRSSVSPSPERGEDGDGSDGLEDHATQEGSNESSTTCS